MKSSTYMTSQQPFAATSQSSVSRKQATNNYAIASHQLSQSQNTSIVGAGESARSHSLVGKVSLGSTSGPHPNIYYSTSYHSHNLMGQKSSKRSNGSEVGSDVKSSAHVRSSKKSEATKGNPGGQAGGNQSNKDSQQANSQGQGSNVKKTSNASKVANTAGTVGNAGGNTAGTGTAAGSNLTGATSNRKCEVCAVDMDPEHPDTADHEAHRVQQRPSKIMLFEIDLEKSEDVLVDLSPFIDLNHKLMLTQENPSWTLKKYWQWKESVMEILDPDSILDMVSTRRMERLFYPDHEDTTTNTFWRNLAERVCGIARMRNLPIKEYDRLEFTERFLPISATLAFDCMFAVGKKEVSYRDERNNEYTRWRDFFVIQSLYTLHEVRHFIIDWLPRKIDLEGVKFTPELQLGIREVREERLENFESRSDLVTCVFFVADIDPEVTGSTSASSLGLRGTNVTTLPHIVVLYNFWIRSYDETRAKDITRTVTCPLFDVYNREVGTNHVLRSYQSYLVMTYMNAHATQGKMVLFKINGMSDNNPELAILESKLISPTITVAANWQKIAYKSLLNPTEVNILLLSELKHVATVNLNPLCAHHQFRIKYTCDNSNTNHLDSLNTYGVSVPGAGEENLKNGTKMPLSTLLNKLNQNNSTTFRSSPVCAIQIHAKVKTHIATIESVLFNMDKIEMIINTKDEFASSTNRGDLSPAKRESKPFNLAPTNNGENPIGSLAPEVFQGIILNYAILNNCIAILFQDNACYRLIKVTA